MYCIVLKYLSPIQKGIQSAHAIVEYSNQYKNTEDYLSWAKNDKTIVVLNGSDCTDINNIVEILDDYSIEYGVFHEESLGNIITAICFLCPTDLYQKVEFGIGTEIENILYEIIKTRHLAN